MEVQPLSLPQTVIGNTVESTFDFHHSGHVGENHLAGLAKLGPRSPSLLPPQRTTVPSGGHVVPSTFLSPWTAYEHLFFFFLVFLQKACLQQCGTLMCSVCLRPPRHTPLLSDLWSHEDLRYDCDCLSKIITSFVWLHRGGGFFYMSAVIRAGVVESVLGPPTAQQID